MKVQSFTVLRHYFTQTLVSRLLNTFRSHLTRYDVIFTAVRAWQTHTDSRIPESTCRFSFFCWISMNICWVHSTGKTVCKHLPARHVGTTGQLLQELILLLSLPTSRPHYSSAPFLPTPSPPSSSSSSSSPPSLSSSVAQQPTIGPWTPVPQVSGCAVLRREGVSPLARLPNLDDQVFVFMTPEDKVAKI